MLWNVTKYGKLNDCVWDSKLQITKKLPPADENVLKWIMVRAEHLGKFTKKINH